MAISELGDDENSKEEEKKSINDQIITNNSDNEHLLFRFKPKKSLCKCLTPDKFLINRMKLCALAICLMWSTSLKVAVYIASFSIEVPQLQQLYKSCKAAFLVTVEERDKYKHCVDVQLNQCNANLDGALAAEINQYNASSLYNDDIVRRARDWNGKCTSAYTSLRYSLESWVNAGNSIPLDDANCSPDQQLDLLRTVGDINAARSEAFSLSEEYSEESMDTVQRIVTYAQLRADYDTEYLDNYTQHVQNKVVKYGSTATRNLPTLNLETIQVKMTLDTESLMQCVSPRNAEKYAGKCQYFKGVQEHLDDVYGQFMEVIKLYYAQLNIFFDRVNEYKDNVQKAYEVSSSFYYGEFIAVTIFSMDIFDFLGFFACVDDFSISRLIIFDAQLKLNHGITKGVKKVVRNFGLGYLPWGSSYKVDVSEFLAVDVNWPKNIPDIGSFEILTTESIWNKVSPALQKFQSNLTSAFNEVQKLVDDTNKDIEESFQQFLNQVPNLVPEDYNPPLFINSNGTVGNVSQEQSLHVSKSQDFVSRSAISLDAFSKLKKDFDQEEIKIESPSVNISNIQNQLSSVDITFEKLKEPKIDIDLWFIQLSSISDLLYLLDFAYRAYFTIRLFFKYWDVGAVKLPQVEMRSHVETSNPFKMSPGRLFVHIITNPFVGMGLIALLSAWILTIASSIYSPLYEEYLTGCVPSNSTGTFVTDNVYSMAYNLGYQQGSASLVEGLDAFDLKRSKSCSSFYLGSVEKESGDAATMFSFATSQDKTMEQMDLLRTCIDTNVADAQFRKACCGQKGYKTCLESTGNESCPLNSFLSPPLPFLTPGEYLQEPSCVMPLKGEDWLLKDSVFNCNRLPSCHVTCIGPHREKLRRVTKECGCIVEWFFHSLWLKAFISLIIYILTNASRIGCLEGLARVSWDKIHPKVFTVLTTCNNSGEIIARGSRNDSSRKFESVEVQVDMDAKFLTERIKSKIEKNMFFFRLEGGFIIVGSLLLNIPWVYLLAVLPDRTKPRW